jgi:uncharacterized protein (TIGR03435 family)
VYTSLTNILTRTHFELHPEAILLRRLWLMSTCRKWCCCLAVAAGMISTVAAGARQLQRGTDAATGHKQLRYDVAVVRPAKAGSSHFGVVDQPDGVSVRNLTLKAIVASAYGLMKTDQVPLVSGGPKWVGSDKYDIQAKMDADTLSAFRALSSAQQADERQRMLQALLADRFDLKVHSVMRSIPVYALVIARSGLKLHREFTGNKNNDANQPPLGSMGAAVGGFNGRAVSLSQIAFLLNTSYSDLGRPVIDQTGDTNKYDFELHWQVLTAADSTGPGGAPVSNSGPSLFSALKQQAGLTLKSTTAPVRFIVIDSAETPSAN